MGNNPPVGKRDVTSGSIRVRAYKVETSIREDVSLRDKNVQIETRPVDRPLTNADRAFTDRTTLGFDLQRNRNPT